MKKIIIISSILFVVLLGCGKIGKNEKDNYSSCNDSSNNNMIETEDGYYYVYDSCIYYADKTDLDNWVPVCNKPSCLHNSYSCNASFLMDGMDEITQKDGKIYGIGTGIGVNPYVYEVNVDGSGKKKVYEIPFGEGIQVGSFRSILFPKYLILHYGYLAEDGMYHRNLARLDEDGYFHILYEQITENKTGDLSMPASSRGVRGDKAIISTLLIEENEDYTNVLWRVDGEEPERVNLPEDINISWGYLTENTFTYFKQKEGFYQVDLTSGEQELLMENQLEDSVGIVLTEEYFIEMNRYAGYKPEDAHLKFYNGERWLEVALPESVSNSDKLFSALSVASDRVFMMQLTENGTERRSELYYFLLTDDEPELIYCDDVSQYGEKQEEETKEEESTEETSENIFEEFEPITVFDNEDFLFQITGVRIDEKKKFCITTYWENRSNKVNYTVTCQYSDINGLTCNLNEGILIKSNTKYEDTDIKDNEIKFNLEENFITTMLDLHLFEIDKIYQPEEYTDITLYFAVEKDGNFEEKVVHVYPYGEENAIRYKREVEETDNVLFDNEYVTVIVRGYGDRVIPNGDIKFYFVNKTDKRLEFAIENLYINDKLIDFTYYVDVNAGCSALHSLTSKQSLMSVYLGENGITQVDKYELHFRVYPIGYVSRYAIEEDIVNETFTLIP